ncbi:MAG: hypothetical protein Q9208_006003 [Pyrenodesmia sp. 3 TL-2023]
MGEESLSGSIRIKAMEFDDEMLDARKVQDSSGEKASTTRLYAVFYPESSSKQGLTFWRLTGLGVSSRRAEQCLGGLANIRQTTQFVDAEALQPHGWSLSHDVIRQRIVALLKRVPNEADRLLDLDTNDVYLYQTGMATIYHVHHTLLNWRGTQSIVFGFTYELTPKLLAAYGRSFRFYGLGTDDELADLETYLEEHCKDANKVQAVWCECPSNPLLRTPNLRRLRALANKYNFPVIVDDTIGSFANVDVMNIADIVVTSLTKSFSGCADVMGGSAVLNPSMPFYQQLKRLFEKGYQNELYVDDAVRLELNSRDVLSRAVHVNTTAQLLVDFFQGLKSGPRSSITAVYYPSLCWSVDNYRAQMRAATDDFTPGYGGLFTIEFESVEKASVFFNNAAVHKGPSLGASMTLLQPYVQTVFYQEKEWAARYGLKESIVRVSVGLEDPRKLLMIFRDAMLKTDGPVEGDTEEASHVSQALHSKL